MMKLERGPSEALRSVTWIPTQQSLQLRRLNQRRQLPISFQLPRFRLITLPAAVVFTNIAIPDWPSGVYAVVVYEVGDSGNADDEIGERTIRGAALGYLDTNTAIFAVTPVEPTASIAYIVPIATFQAYNFTGGGCFYEYRDP